LAFNGHVYKFRIAASNDVGTSEFSHESDLTRTPQSKPQYLAAAMRNDKKTISRSPSLQVKVLSNRRVKLAWYETICLHDLRLNDFLLRFKLVYKLVGLNNKIPQLLALNEQQQQNDNDDDDDDVDSFVYSNSNQVELIIEYGNTSKRLFDHAHANSSQIFSEFNENLNLDRYAIVKHEYLVENNYFLDNGTYEFYLCGINAMGEDSNHCLHSPHLVYLEDRLLPSQSSNSNSNLIESMKALSSTELNITWHHHHHHNGKLIAYKIYLFSNDMAMMMMNIVNQALERSQINFESQQQQQQESSSSTSDLVKLIGQSEYDKIRVIIVEPTQTSVIVTGLKPYRNYSCFIKVLNQAGESLSPMMIDHHHSAQTHQSIPSPPQLILFSYVSYTFLNVTWLRPVDSNGIVLAYELWFENVKPQSAKTKIIRQEIQAERNALN
jgi:hypothetical protein